MTRFAILNGALWAIGSSWSTAIRAVTLQIIPDDSREVVLGEIAAASMTTILSVTVSYVVMRRCYCTTKRGSTGDEEGERPQRRERPVSRI